MNKILTKDKPIIHKFLARLQTGIDLFSDREGPAMGYRTYIVGRNHNEIQDGVESARQWPQNIDLNRSQ